MSEFRVTPEAVAEVSSRLGGISGTVGDLHDRLGTHRAAAEGTPIGGAFAGLLTRWGHVLPLYALAGDRLSAAVGGAATSYTISDGAIADACGGGGAGATTRS